MIDNTLKTYSCKLCGNDFTSRGYHVFYCADCRKEKRKEVSSKASKKYYMSKNTAKVCPVCQKTYRASIKQDFCSLKCAEYALKNGLTSADTDTVESFTFRLPSGSKMYLDSCKKSLGIKSINKLIQIALINYLQDNLDDKELRARLSTLDKNPSITGLPKRSNKIKNKKIEPST